MQRALGYLATRYGVAGLLLVVVLGVVVVARTAGGGDDQTGTGRTVVAPTTPGTAGSSATTEPNDGVVESAPSTKPTLPPRHPDPVPVAMAFTRAWLNHDTTPEQWRAGISRYATRSLMDKLKATDPADVPADMITGTPELTDVGETGWAEVTIPLDSGLLKLGLVFENRRWLVNAVDLERR